MTTAGRERELNDVMVSAGQEAPTTREGWLDYFRNVPADERVSRAIDCLLIVQAARAPSGLAGRQQTTEQDRLLHSGSASTTGQPEGNAPTLPIPPAVADALRLYVRECAAHSMGESNDAESAEVEFAMTAKAWLLAAAPQTTEQGSVYSGSAPIVAAARDATPEGGTHGT